MRDSDFAVAKAFLIPSILWGGGGGVRLVVLVEDCLGYDFSDSLVVVAARMNFV